MGRAKPLTWLLLLTGGMALALAWLVTAVPVAAQCGSSATSCKNCHEVNAEYPVNGSGEWHIRHAFGDFCAFCHAGNVQATAMDAAHEGMVYPLADPQASCQACHPTDYMDQAGVYAVALGVDLGAAASGGASSGSGSGGTTVNPAEAPLQPIAPPGERHASGALIDYNRRYEIEVLGKLDTSQVGNLILAVMAVLLLGVGAALIWRLESLGEVWRKARAVPETDWRQLAASGAYTGRLPVTVQGRVAPAQAPAMVSQTPAVALRPAMPAPVTVAPAAVDLDRLDAPTRRALEALLADSQRGAAILRALSRLDPALIDSLSGLDRKDRALLLAIVEQLGGESER